ncbi:hypothetical protein, conserved [Plasmodium gonderi]|uniref:Uncharacterized protein n=1 Tax=Plasmodium gonderi TaxID=77519 RepID=A0A1Y1JFV4_PLAGO|nr:hypothetical protein, conserved [Plasmodium gonderi]GAW81386.1 hypothetical protein, conserved [Plasmodium gonderi]
MQYTKSKTVVNLRSISISSDSTIVLKKSSTSLKKELHTNVQGKLFNGDDLSEEEKKLSTPKLKSSLKKKKYFLARNALGVRSGSVSNRVLQKDIPQMDVIEKGDVGEKEKDDAREEDHDDAGEEDINENDDDENDNDEDDNDEDDNDEDDNGEDDNDEDDNDEDDNDEDDNDEDDNDEDDNGEDDNDEDDNNEDDNDEDDNDEDDNNEDGKRTETGENNENKKKHVKQKKIATKRTSVFHRLATTHTLSSSNRCVNPKIKKQFTENIHSTMKGGGPKKTFSMSEDKKEKYSSFAPYNKARMQNMEKKLNIIRAKTQILKIAENFMSMDKIKSFKMVKRGNTQSLAKNRMFHSSKTKNLGPFLPHKIGEVKEPRDDACASSYFLGRSERSGNVNIDMKANTSNHVKDKGQKTWKRKNDDNDTNDKLSIKRNFHLNNRSTLKKYQKMVLRKICSQHGFPLFENLLAVNNSGGIYAWGGYAWKKINILYEYFISLCTNKKGHIICINKNFKPGFIMNNNCFQKIDTYKEDFFFKIVISSKNKIWGINLRGDLQKWEKYEWVQEKRAYGISKLRSLAFDRSDNLWVLDQRNYFFIFYTKHKNWMLHNVNNKGRGKIYDFDFNPNNFLVAVTTDGMIKIYKNGRWIKCGILGQMKIVSLHFSRMVEGKKGPGGEDEPKAGSSGMC